MGTAIGLRISSVNGTALLDNCPADILAAVGAQVKIYDASSRFLLGVIGAVGSSEGLGDEKITNGSCDSDTTGWTAYNATLASIAGGYSNNCLEDTSNTAGGFWGAYQNLSASTTALALYKLVGYVKSGTAGNIAYSATFDDNLSANTGTSSGSWVQNTLYRTRGTDGYVRLYGKATSKSGQTILFDEYSLKQVTAPSSSGVTILDAIGGNQNFISKDANFTYNAASYTYEIISGHPAIKRFGGVPFCTQRRNIW